KEHAMSAKRLVRADFFPHVGLLQAQLFGFHINSAHFQPAHADWLRRYAVPLLLSGNFRGIVEGTTSLSGSFTHNERLSLQRATTVYNVLVSACKVSEEKVLKPFGTGFTRRRYCITPGKTNTTVLSSSRWWCRPTGRSWRGPRPPCTWQSGRNGWA